MTRIGIGTALSLRSAQSARLHELVKLPIRALLSWRIWELCCGNDAYFRASHFPGDSCVAARYIGPEVTAFRCASRQVRRANRSPAAKRRHVVAIRGITFRGAAPVQDPGTAHPRPLLVICATQHTGVLCCALQHGSKKAT